MISLRLSQSKVTLLDQSLPGYGNDLKQYRCPSISFPLRLPRVVRQRVSQNPQEPRSGNEKGLFEAAPQRAHTS